MNGSAGLSRSPAWGTRLLVFLFALVGGWILVAPLVGDAPDGALPWNMIVATTFGAVIATLVAVSLFENGEVGAVSAEAGAVAGARLFTLGVGGGILVFAVAFGLAAPAGLAIASDDGGPMELGGVLLTLLGFFLVAAAWEELVFRGYPFVVLERRFGGGAALVATSILFAAVHVMNPEATALGIVNIGLAGLFLGVVYQRTRSLWCVIGVHAGWNWAMAGLADVPVSGLEEGMATPVYSLSLTGPAWWAGGDFGPEGGLAATIAFLLGLVWVQRAVRRRPLPNPAGSADAE